MRSGVCRVSKVGVNVRHDLWYVVVVVGLVVGSLV